MRNKVLFKGVYVPIITPFTEKNELDVKGLAHLIHYYIEQGVSGIVPCGTTGESPTLSHEEHRRIIDITIQEVNKKVPVIAGTGSNNTAEAIALTKHAQKAGADAVLMVSPYYNRPTQAGIIAHFTTIAQNTQLPIILYNIPARTGRNIDTATIIELSKIPNIVGVKDCSNDINQLMDLITGTQNFSILTGEDHQIFITCCLGGHGAIAASAHLMTKDFIQMVAYTEQGMIAEARALHYKLLPLVRALFYESNPAPIKSALTMLGLPAGTPRLPLLPATDKCEQLLRNVLKQVKAL